MKIEDTLFRYASDFRKGIETAKLNRLLEYDYNMSHFPYGCCGDTADLLGQYLLDAGIKTEYVCGCLYYGLREDFSHTPGFNTRT